MKKLLFIGFILITLTSCQLKEEVYFNKDGSGTYNLAIDMSGMLQMGKSIKKDSITNSKKPVVKDSVFHFADLLKDKKSMQRLTDEEKELIEELKDLTMRVYVDEANDKMEMSYIFPFKKVKDLDGFLSKLKKVQSKDKDEKLDMFTKEMGDHSVRYHFNKKRFHREVILSKKKKEKKQDSTNANKQQINQMMEMLQYEIVYHFPYKIKEVTYKGEALLGTDGKTLHIKVPMAKILENPKLLDFSVEF